MSLQSKLSLLLLVAVPLAAQTAAPAPKTASRTPAEAPPKTVSRTPAEAAKQRATFKPVDLNTATREELMKVPGLSGAAADKIIKGRPWLTKSRLVTEGGFTMLFYQSIKDRIFVRTTVPAKK